MRILLIHNKYKLKGGEDFVFETERLLLENKGHCLKQYIFDNSGIDTFSKKISLAYSLIYNQKSKRVMDDLIEDFKPDVIHVHNFFYRASPSIFFSAFNHNIPVVVTLHNYRLICSGSLLMRDSIPCELCIDQTFPMSGVKYACHRQSRIETAHLTLTTGIHKIIDTWVDKISIYISLTEFAREKFINSSLRLPREQVVVKPNSVDDVMPASVNERENYFLYIGRLSKEKGIEVLLRAFKNSNTVIEIIGDGPLREDVEKTCLTHSNIKYWGYRDKSFITSRLKKSKALIVPSICYESLPTTVLEAFSSGTPVIISNLGNLNQIVTHQYNGIHFKANDPEDLIRVANDFSANYRQHELLYHQSRKTYLEKYTPELNYRNLIHIYDLAIARFNKPKTGHRN